MQNDQEIVVIANNAVEMKSAQVSLIGYFQNKLDQLNVDLSEADQNIEIAKKRKWKVLPFQNLKRKFEKDFSFYEKIKAALDAGYVIIPNLNEVDVFAIRTTRKNPKGNVSSGGASYVQPPMEQESNTPSLGDGRYVNANTINEQWTKEEKLSNGAVFKKQMMTAIEFDDVNFPFKFVKPEIMERTAEAKESFRWSVAQSGAIGAKVRILPGQHDHR